MSNQKRNLLACLILTVMMSVLACGTEISTDANKNASGLGPNANPGGTIGNPEPTGGFSCTESYWLSANFAQTSITLNQLASNSISSANVVFERIPEDSDCPAALSFQPQNPRVTVSFPLSAEPLASRKLQTTISLDNLAALSLVGQEDDTRTRLFTNTILEQSGAFTFNQVNLTLGDLPDCTFTVNLELTHLVRDGHYVLDFTTFTIKVHHSTNVSECSLN